MRWAHAVLIFGFACSETADTKISHVGNTNSGGDTKADQTVLDAGDEAGRPGVVSIVDNADAAILDSEAVTDGGASESDASGPDGATNKDASQPDQMEDAGEPASDVCVNDTWIDGLWVEVAQIECLFPTERDPEQPIGELKLDNGNISVTWTPFETYYDYWGRYTAMPYGGPAGLIEFTVQDGNYIPSDITSMGSFELCGDELVLTGVWLGSPQFATQPPACGHRFRRF